MANKKKWNDDQTEIVYVYIGWMVWNESNVMINNNKIMGCYWMSANQTTYEWINTMNERGTHHTTDC